MKPTTLTAPKLSAAERKQLTDAKTRLEKVIVGMEGDAKKVADLQIKQAALEKEAGPLQRAAAQFNPDGELKLLANQRMIARVHDAIRAAEAAAHDGKEPLWRQLDPAQELVGRICQATYEELLDLVGAALAPFYNDFNNARYRARDTPAVHDLVHVLLRHSTSAGDSIERLVQAARETLAKIDACLAGSVIYSFQGAESPTAQAA